jgi:hypothetical protein
MASVPVLRLTAFYRYADPSWEMAVVVLAALGMHDVALRRTRWTVLGLAAVTTALVVIWSGLTAVHLLAHTTLPTHTSENDHWTYPVVSGTAALIILALLTAGGYMASRPRMSLVNGPEDRCQPWRRRGRMMMAAAVCLESVLLCAFPYLSAPRPTNLDLNYVKWLQAHLGTYRFYTLGPIQPNYGSYFSINEVNSDDLPLSNRWVTFVHQDLDPNSPPGLFTGGSRVLPSGPSPSEELTKNLAHFEAVGVRYVIESASSTDTRGQPFPEPGTPPWPFGPRLVYHDGRALIWELPAPHPFFTLAPSSVPATASARNRSPGRCSISWSGPNDARVICPHPTTVTRLEQFLPGWSVDIDGRIVAVRRSGHSTYDIFQSVTVPTGTTDLHYTYLPPHEAWGLVIGIISVSVVVGGLGYQGERVRRTRRRAREEGTDRAATGFDVAEPTSRHGSAGPDNSDSSASVGTGPAHHAGSASLELS